MSPVRSIRGLPWKKRIRFRLINWWPPFRGAGIRVTRIAPDLSSFDVEMTLHWWNRNYVGTHFGGSLYSMCDPFFMLILIERLGRNYIVWDKAASIRYLRPARGRVRAHFAIPDSEVERIRAAADREGKIEPEMSVAIIDEEGQRVAEVTRILWVKRKPDATAGSR